MNQTHLPPLFFSSIPKCGKNLIYSFFFALGYKRFWFKDEAYNIYSNYLPFNEWHSCEHYVYKRSLSVGIDKERALANFEREICSIPVAHIGHRHIHADDEVLSALKVGGIKPIFIYRDPRDCLLSAVHYAFKGQPIHISEMLRGLSEEDALFTLLDGDNKIIPFSKWFDAYKSWLHVPNAIIVRFEDIIGARGGGSNVTQKDTLEYVIKSLGIQVSSQAFEKALSTTFNPKAGTFRSGQIGGWRNSFSPKIIREFDLKAGYLLNEWQSSFNNA